ncbi:MAG TPA: COX15/CtaA family protein [Candidatus Microbacterium stercoravium]|uniref:COX15/CtaA family protein n=1 Tax=Candidatus Microbacterium stercoravium TaxID=2838697 RepID=A0A9D2H7J5_9MICO|nr:COX15/CtaA family protein [Candidatus Microbacterium stercoravium]
MTISPALRVFAWLSLIAEVIIIGTGGAVRLTGSGLGCDQWPMCTPGSLVPTEELGIHGLIEFGNRTMTGAVGILALVVLLLALSAAGGRRAVVPAVVFAVGGVAVAIGAYAAFTAAGASGAVPMSVVLLAVVLVGAVYSLAKTPVRRDLLALAWIVMAGVMAQAVVGGSAVLTGLNPFIVGFHYASSLTLVCVTAAFLVRLGATPGPRERAVPKWYMILAHVTSLVLAVTIAVGVLTTGNGPHSGDEAVVREGFDASILAHVHSWPGYTLFALALVLTAAAWAGALPTRRWASAFTGVLVVQIAVGVWQANAALPPLLVGIHMVLAALSAGAYVVTILRLKRPVAAPARDAALAAR